jgi:hypothetical protein
MRLLADENLPRPTVEFLRSRGHDILWARTDCPGLKDRALLSVRKLESVLRNEYSWVGHPSIVTKHGIEMILMRGH